ncbi:NAD(P)-binding protein [Coniophora puteana RWD-64-598 SS2]|uniref:NAD(P)-binding protein n=1 Tax=Coniophora puteana (strain RWD-64-598) TaxID=741705 RepID=A0A5M3MAP9_CONPW|nr:NAD(P)-binding protein [Coniophora puteana RWD-64-598 SS2]EIW75860.1 NAD(P)-binding protein [Coniophora puteana RWD-64-598 SS2]
MASSHRVWLITGASSGFGRAMAELALKNGDKVAATLRNPSALDDLVALHPTGNLLVLKVDVTQSEHTTAAFTQAYEKFGRIDIVFNNAGLLTIGEIEAFPEDEARKLFEVNFWGAVHVTREALRQFREVNKPAGGHLLNVSSAGGIVGIPGNAYYCATKFALEGFSEAAAKEVDPSWNIKVTIVEPGPFATKMVKENIKRVPNHPAYADPKMPGNQFAAFITSPQDGDTIKAVAQIDKLTRLDSPPLRFPIHRDPIGAARAKSQEWKEVADKWESWSEDVYLEK